MAATTRFQTNLMNNTLILLSGADIPFIEGTITIHQPTIKEISLIGEDSFFQGCELLKFSKDMLRIEDQSYLENYTDFNILMSILNDNGASMQHSVSCAKLVLQLLFPLYEIEFAQQGLLMRLVDQQEICGGIVEKNFLAFKNILSQMFCLQKQSTEQYNPQGEMAKKIAEKFKQRKQQLADLQPQSKRPAIFSRYISVLAVGEHKDINSLMQYTVYQLFDEFQRYQLKMGYDMFIKAKIAGASDLTEPEDWMKDLHSD